MDNCGVTLFRLSPLEADNARSAWLGRFVGGTGLDVRLFEESLKRSALVGLAETGVDDALTDRLTGAIGAIATRIVDFRMTGALTCAFGLLKFMMEGEGRNFMVWSEKRIAYDH
jgi:hypothetical protein